MTTKPLVKLTQFELAKAIEVLYKVKINLDYVGIDSYGYELPQLLEANGIRITGAQEFQPGDLYHTTGICRAAIAGTPFQRLFPDSHVWKCAAKALIFKSTQSEDIDAAVIKDALVHAYAVYGIPANENPVLIGFVSTQNEWQTLHEAWLQENPPPPGESKWTGYANSSACLRSELTTVEQWKASNTKPQFVIYSPKEASGDGCGFWSNIDGWGEFEQATRFTEIESRTLNLPLSPGGDARWVPAPMVLMLTKTAQDLAARYGHTSADSNTTLLTKVNPDASDGHDEMMDLNVCGVGTSAYFEWVSEYGDPIGDVFHTAQISEDDLPLISTDTPVKGDAP